MRVDIHAGQNVEGHEEFASQVRGVVESVLDRFRDHIAHVEVRLNDEDPRKSGQIERRCMLEASLAGRERVAVTHQATTPAEAVRGAAEKMTSLIENCFMSGGVIRDPDAT